MAKDPYECIPDEWKQNQLAPSTTSDKLRAEITKVAMDNAAYQAARELDGDYQSAKVALSVASEGYRESNKVAKAKTAFLMETLRGRGEKVPGADDFVTDGKKNKPQQKTPES